MKTYTEAILKNVPNMEFSVTNDGRILEWHGDNKPTDAQVQAWYEAYKEPNPRIAELKTELAALDIKRIRPAAEGDTAYLATLNAQAVALRAELQALL